MELEFAAGRIDTSDTYPFGVAVVDGGFVIDWEPMIRAILESSHSRVEEIAARFHETLADMIVRVAIEVSLEKVVLSGGVFQNARLLGSTREKLEKAGLRVFTHQRIPPNDGGIAAGQIMVAAAGGGFV